MVSRSSHWALDTESLVILGGVYYVLVDGTSSGLFRKVSFQPLHPNDVLLGNKSLQTDYFENYEARQGGWGMLFSCVWRHDRHAKVRDTGLVPSCSLPFRGMASDHPPYAGE